MSAPVIRLGVEVHRVADEAIAALAAGGDVYCRAGSLVRVVRNGSSPPGVVRAQGSASVLPMHAATLLERLTKVAEWEKFNPRAKEGDPKWVASVPSAAVVQAVEHRGEWPGIREIVGILEAPALRPDGSVIQEPGFDTATGYLYAPACEFPRIKDAPTIAEVHAARDELLEVVCDFPFGAAEHRSAWLAFLLTLHARPAIDGCVPLMSIDAAVRASGKTRLVDATSLIATGRIATKMPMPSDDEEMRKRLTSLILEAEPIACIDNATGPIAFASLDAALTAMTWKDRVLGRTAMVSAPNRMVCAVNGNNLMFGADTARRALHIRLESQLESPEDREDLRHPLLLAWVQANRPRLVAAALTILRGYAVAGMPSAVKPWGSFEEWSRVVAGAVVWCGMVDPQSTRSELEATADTTKNALAGLIDGWARLTKLSGAITAKRAISVLYPPRHPNEPAPADTFDDLRDAIEALAPPMPGKPPSPSKLGAALRSVRRRVVAKRMLDGTPDRKGTTEWSVVEPKRAGEATPETAGHAGVEGHVSPLRESAKSDVSLDGEVNITGNSGMSGAAADPDFLDWVNREHDGSAE